MYYKRQWYSNGRTMRSTETEQLNLEGIFNKQKSDKALFTIITYIVKLYVCISVTISQASERETTARP